MKRSQNNEDKTNHIVQTASPKLITYKIATIFEFETDRDIDFGVLRYDSWPELDDCQITPQNSAESNDLALIAELFPQEPTAAPMYHGFHVSPANDIKSLSQLPSTVQLVHGSTIRQNSPATNGFEPLAASSTHEPTTVQTGLIESQNDQSTMPIEVILKATNGSHVIVKTNSIFFATFITSLAHSEVIQQPVEIMNNSGNGIYILDHLLLYSKYIVIFD